MESTSSLTSGSESLLQQMAAEIQQEIPGAEVRLFGSHARGEARPDSDIDLLLYSRTQVAQRQALHSSVLHQACTHGWRLDG